MYCWQWLEIIPPPPPPPIQQQQMYYSWRRYLWKCSPLQPSVEPHRCGRLLKLQAGGKEIFYQAGNTSPQPGPGTSPRSAPPLNVPKVHLLPESDNVQNGSVNGQEEIINIFLLANKMFPHAVSCHGTQTWSIAHQGAPLVVTFLTYFMMKHIS